MPVKVVVTLKNDDTVELAGAPEMDFLSDPTEEKLAAVGLTPSGNTGRANKYYKILNDLLNGTKEATPVYDDEGKIIGYVENYVAGSLAGWKLKNGDTSLAGATSTRIPRDQIALLEIVDY